MKSVLASESPAESEASQHVQPDFSALNRRDEELAFMHDYYDDLDELRRQRDEEEK